MLFFTIFLGLGLSEKEVVSITFLLFFLPSVMYFFSNLYAVFP